MLGGVVTIAAITVTQLIANLGYDSSASSYRDAVEIAAAAKIHVSAETDQVRASAEAGQAILARDDRAIAIAPALGDALQSDVSDGEEAVTRADDLLSTELAPVGAKPVWFWELFGAAVDLDDRQRDADRFSASLAAAEDELSETRDAMSESGVAVVVAAGEAAPAFEAAHVSARNDAVIALRDAADDAIATTILDDTAASAYAAVQDAAAQVVATEAAELAEKSGPLQGARVEAEAFARSLAPGVLLEFDWSPVVNGAGYDGSMGGYTTWWWDEPGRAVIELSDSVAEQWPADRAKALIAHEVGHAISVKCQDMYDSSTQDSIEKWATAWAISMGFTDDANGVWAYGYPPQNYIDAAAGCR